MAALEAFQESEEMDGVRFSWNFWPTSSKDLDNMVVPIGCVYSPLRPERVQQVKYDPIPCKGPCQTVLNPHCLSSLDLAGKLWTCPFCYQRNQFPPHYASISNTNLPAELIPSFTTIEYVLSKAPALPPVFLFVVDTCLPEAECLSLKSSLLLALSLLPDHAVVGLVTFGSTVSVYELAFEHCPKAFVFRGKKDYTAPQVAALLGLAAHQQQPRPATYHGAPSGPSVASAAAAAPQAPLGHRFLMSKRECEFTLEAILEDLQADPRLSQPGHRPVRSTGAALSVAVGLLEACRVGSAARVMAFLGGPCTQGPGLVVAPPLSEPIRMHYDLRRGSAKHSKKASEFYAQLAERAAQNGHCVDLFSCAYDQVGILEMQRLPQLTGGAFILTDEFQHDMFRDSFKKMFARDPASGLMRMAFNATYDVRPSRELKILGAVGHCSPSRPDPRAPQQQQQQQQQASVSSARTIGHGGTCSWRAAGVDPHTNVSFFFELAAPSFQPSQDQKGLVQFKTAYTNSSGAHVLRVTTVARAWVPPAPPAADPWGHARLTLSHGFDQEAAAVLMARIAVFKDESTAGFQSLQWLDRALIKFCGHFADYHRGDESSFALAPNLSLYPQFMFHLRRSPILQHFNNSPDESTYNRFMLQRENVSNCMSMIQPTLEAYSFSSQEPFAVLLSATSIAQDRILLLDTFFHICIWSGSTIADWRTRGFHADPNYSSFKRLLEMPVQDVAAILQDRFPRPRFIECDQGSSQARFLLAVIDPAITHNSIGAGASGEVVFTEDVSLEVFMQHLKKLSVTNPK